jgi:hypothetical protein
LKFCILLILLAFSLPKAFAGVSEKRADSLFEYVLAFADSKDAEIGMMVDEDPNAETSRVDYRKSLRANGDRKAYIVILLGKAFLKKTDAAGFSIIAAHEIGHVVGHPGGGQYSQIIERTLTVEGEADYQAGLILRRAYNKDPKEFRRQLFKGLTIAASPLKMARASLKNEKRLDPEGQETLAKLLVSMAASLDAGQKDIRFSSCDKILVTSTLEGYPSPQARIDTFRAGFLGDSRPRSWARLEDFK